MPENQQIKINKADFVHAMFALEENYGDEDLMLAMKYVVKYKEDPYFNYNFSDSNKGPNHKKVQDYDEKLRPLAMLAHAMANDKITSEEIEKLANLWRLIAPFIKFQNKDFHKISVQPFNDNNISVLLKNIDKWGINEETQITLLNRMLSQAQEKFSEHTQQIAKEILDHPKASLKDKNKAVEISRDPEKAENLISQIDKLLRDEIRKGGENIDTINSLQQNIFDLAEKVVEFYIAKNIPFDKDYVKKIKANYDLEKLFAEIENENVTNHTAEAGEKADLVQDKRNEKIISATSQEQIKINKDDFVEAISRAWEDKKVVQACMKYVKTKNENAYPGNFTDPGGQRPTLPIRWLAYAVKNGMIPDKDREEFVRLWNYVAPLFYDTGEKISDDKISTIARNITLLGLTEDTQINILRRALEYVTHDGFESKEETKIELAKAIINNPKASHNDKIGAFYISPTRDLRKSILESRIKDYDNTIREELAKEKPDDTIIEKAIDDIIGPCGSCVSMMETVVEEPGTYVKKMKEKYDLKKLKEKGIKHLDDYDKGSLETEAGTKEVSSKDKVYRFKDGAWAAKKLFGSKSPYKDNSKYFPNNTKNYNN